MKSFLQCLRPSVLLLCLFAATGAIASEKSVTVFPAEGNKTCNDYASNKLVQSMSVNSPILGQTVTLSGSDLATDGDALPEYVTYQMSANGKSLRFDPTPGPTPPKTNTPIDYVVLKSGSTVSVVIYPAGGVTSDTNLSIPGPSNTSLTITAFSICYGLGNVAPTPPDPVKAMTPACTMSGLDGQGILCSGTTHPVLLCSMELDQPFFGLKSGDTCCVCNNAALTECDPSLAEGAEGACPGPTNEGVAKEVTTTIEINKDPYYCTTVGGTKKCYKY